MSLASGSKHAPADDKNCRCLVGLLACLASCLEILGGFFEPETPCRVAPVIRERVLARRRSGADVLDIHTLLVCPDPGRSVKKSYKTVKPIGKGGFGSVYKVLYLPTGEERAIKMIHKPTEPVETRRLLTEVELLISLDHPNIEKFFEFFEDAKAVCLVTELCAGGNLGELDPREDSSEDIRLLFRDVISAIAYCHSEGVVHRDMKFENCLLTQPEGEHTRRFAKVIDFGLSAVRPQGERADQWMDEAVGTAYFIAPEVLRSEHVWSQKYGPKCDMWSIGVMLFIVLTDQHPFAKSATSAHTIISRIRRQNVRSEALDEAGVDPRARDLLMKLLVKDPTIRMGGAEALRHSFFRDASRSRINTQSGALKVTAQGMRCVMSQICSFARYTRFEKAILTLVAHDAQCQEVEDLRAAFLSLDTTRAGWLSRDGVATALKARGVQLLPEELEAAFLALDPDGDDKIQYTDWLAATMKPASLTSEKAMREIFDFFDIHGEGKVSHADLVQVLGDDVFAAGLPADMEAESNGDVTWAQFQRLISTVARNLQSEVLTQPSQERLRSRPLWLRPRPSTEGLP